MGRRYVFMCAQKSFGSALSARLELAVLLLPLCPCLLPVLAPP